MATFYSWNKQQPGLLYIKNHERSSPIDGNFIWLSTLGNTVWHYAVQQNGTFTFVLATITIDEKNRKLLIHDANHSVSNIDGYLVRNGSKYTINPGTIQHTVNAMFGTDWSYEFASSDSRKITHELDTMVMRRLVQFVKKNVKTNNGLFYPSL